MKMINTNMINLTLSRGFSLVSLMIAMVIGIFIIGAAGQVYVQSKASFNARAAVSAVSENGRFAIQDLRRTLAMTGMNITASDELSNVKRAIPPLDTVTLLDAIATGTGTYDGGANSDIVAVRYRRGPTCYGYVNLPLSDDPVTVRLFVENDQLMCEKIVTNNGILVSRNKRPLVSGIKLMKVLYGVDDDADGYADRYLTAGSLTGFWSNIVSIRVGLVVNSGERNQPLDMRSDTDQTLSLLGMDYTVPANDEKLYKVFSATVQLRNLNPIMQKQ